jgi:hypothetical protein
MNFRPLQLLALCAAVLRGLAEFASLQTWRLRDGWSRERRLR